MVVKAHPKVLALRILKARLHEGLPYRTLVREMRRAGVNNEAAMAAIGELRADGCVDMHPVRASESSSPKRHYVTEKGAELLFRYLTTEPLGTRRS